MTGYIDLENLNQELKDLILQDGGGGGGSDVNFTQDLKDKLDGIEEQANKYELPIATPDTLGGVKVDNDTIVVNAEGAIAVNQYYRVTPPPDSEIPTGRSLMNHFSDMIIPTQVNLENGMPVRKIGTTVYVVKEETHPIYFNNILSLVEANNIILDSRPDAMKVELYSSDEQEMDLFISKFEMYANNEPMQTVVFTNPNGRNPDTWSKPVLLNGKPDYFLDLNEELPTATPADIQQGSVISYIEDSANVQQWKELLLADTGENLVFDRVIVENFKNPKMYRNNTDVRFTLQQVSLYNGTNRVGKYYRASNDNTTFGALKPFETGAVINLPEASLVEKGIVQLSNIPSADEDKAITPKALQDTVDSLGQAINDAVNPLATALTNHESKIATETEYGHVKLHNGNSHTANDGTALDARQGRLLSTQIQVANSTAVTARDNLAAHVQTKASTTQLGHVMIDGSTITIDANGVISANQGHELKTQLDAHTGNQDIHMTTAEKAKLASIEEGATKVEADGTTIVVNGDGKLEAVAPLPTWGNF